ncbi:MAG: methyltransferase domain-containing protein [Opitutales bacterium]
MAGKEQVSTAPGFDRLAPVYSGLEYLLSGPLLQRVRRDAVGALRPGDRVLFLGEGNGRALTRALQTGRGRGAVIVDGSSALLRRARERVRRLPHAAALTWLQADLETGDLHGLAPCDTCLTCFCLDCFPADNLGAVIRRVDKHLKPDARWVVADFVEPPAPRGWRHWGLRGLYAFFRRTTGIGVDRVVDPAPALEALGYRRRWTRDRANGWLRTTVWARETG